MMYGIDIFDDINMPVDWSLIHFGIKNSLLYPTVAQDFSLRQIETSTSVSDQELELAYGKSDTCELLDLIEKIPAFMCVAEDQLSLSQIMIRVAILSRLRNTIQDPDTLLQEISKVYAMFGYPSDMDAFIPYMPQDGYDSSIYSTPTL